MENQNKKHWDEMGGSYDTVWNNKSRKYLHFKEVSFINYFLNRSNSKKVLDIGIGSGRILENYLKNSKIEKIYGFDISDEMVRVCEKRFFGNEKIKKITKCDFSKEDIPFDLKFDFISSIRVLKYNKNWKEMVTKIQNYLSDDGIAVFTMPNKFSLNIFGRYYIPYYRTSKKEIREICKKNGLKILELKTFTRIPDVFYELSNNNIYSNMIIFLEKFLEVMLGKTFFGRMFFIAVRKG